MAISIDEYKNKFAKTKIAKMEDGTEFEIRKISIVDMWEVSKENTKDVIAFSKNVILKGVVNPKITEEGDTDSLAIRDLIGEHYIPLANDIMIYSGIKNEKGESKDFLSQKAKV